MKNEKYHDLIRELTPAFMPDDVEAIARLIGAEQSNLGSLSREEFQEISMIAWECHVASQNFQNAFDKAFSHA